MTKEIPRVFVDAIRSRSLELFPAVTTREEADAERAGLACSTWSRVITGTCAGSIPIAFRLGLAPAIRPLVATAQGTLLAVKCSSSSLVPGNGRTCAERRA